MKQYSKPLTSLLVVCAVVALIWPQTTLAQENEQARGSVSGTIIYDDRIPSPPPLDMEEHPECAAFHEEPVPNEILVLGEGNTMGNIYVWINNPPLASYDIPAEPVIIQQKGCLFSPRASAAMVGQPIWFTNADSILHFLRASAIDMAEFTFKLPAGVEKKELIFNMENQAFPIKSETYPWMKTYIAVFPHPYFTITNPDGTYTIEGLPPGTYDVGAWHERLGVLAETITITEKGESHTLDFNFTFR